MFPGHGAPQMSNMGVHNSPNSFSQVPQQFNFMNTTSNQYQPQQQAPNMSHLIQNQGASSQPQPSQQMFFSSSPQMSSNIPLQMPQTLPQMNTFQPINPARLSSPQPGSPLPLARKERKRSHSDSVLVDPYPKPGSPKSSLKKKRSCTRWTEEENKRLMEAYVKHEGKNWSAIAKAVGNKTSDQCNQHWHRVLNPKISKKPWTEPEDGVLISRVNEFGESSWKKISEGLDGRTDLQCRHRWTQLKKTMQSSSPTSPRSKSRQRSSSATTFQYTPSYSETNSPVQSPSPPPQQPNFGYSQAQPANVHNEMQMGNGFASSSSFQRPSPKQYQSFESPPSPTWYNNNTKATFQQSVPQQQFSQGIQQHPNGMMPMQSGNNSFSNMLRNDNNSGLMMQSPQQHGGAHGGMNNMANMNTMNNLNGMNNINSNMGPSNAYFQSKPMEQQVQQFPPTYSAPVPQYPEYENQFFQNNIYNNNNQGNMSMHGMEMSMRDMSFQQQQHHQSLPPLNHQRPQPQGSNLLSLGITGLLNAPNHSSAPLVQTQFTSIPLAEEMAANNSGMEHFESFLAKDHSNSSDENFEQQNINTSAFSALEHDFKRQAYDMHIVEPKIEDVSK